MANNTILIPLFWLRAIGPQIEDFLEDTEGLLDQFHVPKSPVASSRHKGLYFVGFDNYKLGGILGTIFTDSELIVNDIKNQIK